ncbi:MAG TPA: ferric reductase-like transmembrane domain-containing protein [Propionibacteriaceae bacterium]
MTALVTARPAAPPASPPLPVGGDAAVDRALRLAAVLALWLGLLLVTYWWVADGGVCYASGQWAEVVSTIWDLITNYGGMLLAVAGTACLIMVVVTSVKAARRRLRYESWHLLHLYGYLGVGLALPHQLWTGQEFLQSPAATVYWWTLWAVAAAAIVVWRIWLPLWRSARHRLRVAGVVRESSDVVSVYLTGRLLDRLPLRAGQFIARELEVLAAERGLDVLHLPGPRRTPSSVLGPAALGMPELTALRRWIPDLIERDVFLCGPSAWTEGVERLVRSAGVPADRVHTESFGW